MSVSNNFVRMYDGVHEQPVDKQIVMLCSLDGSTVNPAIVLAQYKFCIRRGIDNGDFTALRSYLARIFSEKDVKSLEVSNGRCD